MIFLVDNQLPRALVHFFNLKGVHCKHVLDIGMSDASDMTIWEYASQNGCIVVSKDEDFLYLAKARSSEARLVWIRLGNCRKKTLLASMEAAQPRIEQKLNAGERIVELR